VSFSWPWALLALLVIPLVFAAWWLTRRRRRRAAVLVTSIALVRTALPGRSRWRRRIPAALLTLGLAVLAVGAARPQATVPVASTSATIMLALDVSGSMCSTDVKPNRITAAEQAATSFIKSQAGGPRIGLLTFASSAVVLVPPTADTGQLTSAIGGLTTSFGTAIGQGILTSLDAIAQVDPSVPPTGAAVFRGRGAGYADDVIVVLTDGSNNRGIDPRTAARQAADRGVRVFTIGYGTDNPAPLACGPAQFGGFNGAGLGYGRGGAGNPLDADYGALMQISRATGGTFYRAQDAGQLATALARLPAAFTIVRKHIDIASWFAAGGGLLIAAALALSLWWNRSGGTARPGKKIFLSERTAVPRSGLLHLTGRVVRSGAAAPRAPGPVTGCREARRGAARAGRRCP
jgi:Ca-activated chloride channel family protein